MQRMADSKETSSSAKIAPELSDTQRMMYAFGDSRRPKVEEDDETENDDNNEDDKDDDNKERNKEDENE